MPLIKVIAVFTDDANPVEIGRTADMEEAGQIAFDVMNKGLLVTGEGMAVMFPPYRIHQIEFWEVIDAVDNQSE